MMSFGLIVSQLYLLLALASLTLYAKLLSSDNSKYTLASYYCSDEGFDPDSSYESDLKQLLSFLPSNASESRNNGYYAVNTTVLATSNSETIIYAAFLCRGDTTAADCRGCVSTAISSLPLDQCPTDKSATVWYDMCMVRYSDNSFLGRVDEAWGAYQIYKSQDNVTLITKGDVNSYNRYMNLVGDTMLGLAPKLRSSGDLPGSSREGARRYYMTQSVSFNSFTPLFTMVQCTPDLLPRDCEKCIDDVVNKIFTDCNGCKGGRSLNPSCNVRYETYSFYDDVSFSPSPGPTSVVKRRRKTSPSVNINIVLGILVLIVVILVIALIWLLRKRRSTVEESIRNYRGETDAQTSENGKKTAPFLSIWRPRAKSHNGPQDPQ